MTVEITDNIFSSAVKIRRALHEYPETGFELQRTVALVADELKRIGLEPTYKYGKGSVVA